jgi:septal ring factor EnvC (AmiA/AmiB activator)
MAEIQKTSVNDSGADLRDALGRIAQIILSDDMKSINDSINTVEIKTLRQIEKLKRELSATIEMLSKEAAGRSTELSSAIGGVKQDLEKASAALEAKLGKVSAEANDRTMKSEQVLHNEIAANQSVVVAKLDAFREKTAKEVTELQNDITVYRNELAELRSQASYFSSVLAGFAKIFSPPTNQETQPAAAPAPVPVATKPSHQPPSSHADFEVSPVISVPNAGATSATSNPKEVMLANDTHEESTGWPNSTDISKTIDTMFNIWK